MAEVATETSPSPSQSEQLELVNAAPTLNNSHTQSEPTLETNDKDEDEELDATDTSRDDEEEEIKTKTQDEPMHQVAAHLQHLQRSHSHLEEPSRAASCSSLSTSSGAGSASSVASLARRSVSNAKLNNPLKGDTNLKIFLPSDSLALKAILSPQNSRSPSFVETPQTGAKYDENGSSTNLLDKLLFRGNGPSTPTTPKKSMGSIADEDLEATNVVVMNINLPPPPFANMYACESCREDIGSLLTGKGRHHCRNCGGSFCAECTQQTIIVPYQAYLSRGELRVCDGCYHRIKSFQKQVKSTSVTWSGLQPPSSEAIVRNFQLSEDEAPVSIFNCAFFMEITPFYGHLVLTRKRLCFQSYADSKKIKLSYSQIISLLKPQFYYINGLQIKTKRKETFFLAEFNGLRDTCFLRLDQLIRAYQEASKVKGGGPGKSPSSKELRKQALDRRRSSKLIAEHITPSSSTGSAGNGPRSFSSAMLNPPVSSRVLSNLASNSSGTSTVGFIDVEEDEDANGETPLSNIVEEGGIFDTTDDGKSTTSDEEPFEPLPPDPLLEKMTVLLDYDMRADVKRVFDLLWNDGPGQEFLRANMEKARDIGIDIESWKAINKDDPVQAEELRQGFEISKEDDYTLFRRVSMQHPPKISFPGLPPYAHCTRTQRFRLDKSSQGGDKWDRFVVSELNRMTKIPFSDYFEVESRYVFSRDGNNYCHVQVGLVVNFLKATWFKSQINSSTRSESKEALESWAKQAIEFLESQRNRVVLLSPTMRALSSAGTFNEIEAVTSSAPSMRKRAASAARATIKGVDSAAPDAVEGPVDPSFTITPVGVKTAMELKCSSSL
ncbi:hypothetical protein BBJ29_009487 [Phytophthora kernoviae]|uniref:FYVE-type domain-containing protein n=1 Tax=Phytophthora kernoviae TaxID=325452 RepID=A0A3R7K9B5_9STRA|nr:hypothetical protein BBJ29_009487 [Phytophthora kernoviae]